MTLYLFPQSPWSKKAKLVFNYKEIPVTEVVQDVLVRRRVLKPALGAVTSPVLWGADGPQEALTDSTDIVAWAEQHKPDPSIRHDDPGLEAVSLLLEEMVDEWLNRHYLALKWLNAPDRGRNTTLMLKALLPWAPASLQQRLAPRLTGPILKALPGLGVTEENKPVLEKSLRRFLKVLEPIHYDSNCLLGPYPVLADFAVHALVSHIQRDPTGERMLLEDFPELCAYLNQMEANAVARVERHDAWEARGHESKLKRERISVVLEYMAGEFLAWHVANAQAVAEGRNETAVELAPGEVFRAPASKRQEGRFRKVLGWLDDLRRRGVHLLGTGESPGEKAVDTQVRRAREGAGGKALLDGMKHLQRI